MFRLDILGYIFIVIIINLNHAEVGANDPVFTHPEWPGRISVTISDDTTVMTSLAKISADDDNLAADNYPVWYFIKDIEPNGAQSYPFWMDQFTGELWLQPNPGLNAAAINTYRLQICALNDKDKDKCGKNANNGAGFDGIEITITEVLNVPTWVSLPGSLVLSETFPLNVLWIAEASDPDVANKGQTLTYSISSTTPGGAPFSIDGATGEISLIAALDYESVNFYTLEIEATDGTNVITEYFNITVTNVNEVPVVTGIPTSLSYVEEQTNIQVLAFTVSVTDPDFDPVTVTMSCWPTNCPYRYDPLTGNVYLNDTFGNMDYEVEQDYTMTLIITDGLVTLPFTIPVSVIPVNEPPTITNLPANVSVMENEMIGRFVYDVDVTDIENDAISYYLVANPADSAGFSIDITSGAITFMTSPGFDYETHPSYTLSIMATDGVTMVGPEMVYVTVIDVPEPPRILNLPGPAFLSEDTVVGTVIYTVICTDPDIGDNLTFTMFVNPASGNGKFSVDAAGVVSVISNPGLDFETAPVYWIQVTVTDSFGYADTNLLTVNIGDVAEPPAFTSPDVTLVVDEEQVVGDAVAGVSVTAVDTDVGDIITYSLMSTPGSEDFLLDTSVNPPILVYNRSVDYDTSPLPIFYNLKIKAEDTSGMYSLMYVDISYRDINDNLPVFSSSYYVTSIVENLPVGNSVLKVFASDADVTFGQVAYVIDPAYTNGQYFDIDINSGLITVAKLADYETVKSFTFDIIATDNGGLTSRTTVKVNILDDNDNSPYFLSSFYNHEIRADAASGYEVGSVEATDIDTFLTTLTYRLEDPVGMFRMNASTGYIDVKGNLTAGTEYTLYGYATDSGNGAQLTSKRTIIRVDGYEPCSHLISLGIQMAPSSLYNQSDRDTFVSALKRPFSNAIPRIVTIDGMRPEAFDGIGQGGYTTVVTVIFLKDSTSLSETAVGQAKTLVDVDTLIKTLGDGNGGPSAELMTAIQAYFPVTYVNVTEPCPVLPIHWWTQTTPGIVTLSTLASLGTAILGLLMAWSLCLIMKSWNKPVPKPWHVYPKKTPDGGAKLMDFRYNEKDEANAFRQNNDKSAEPRTARGVALAWASGGR